MSVLLCYDGSPSARRSLNVAAVTLGDEPVVLLHVFNPPERILPDAFGLKDADNPSDERLRGLVADRANQVIAEGQGLAEEVGITVTPRLEPSHSTVWKTILDVADDVDAELIVAGTHGRTAVETGLLGSVSNALVHNSPRPVLIVPSNGDKEA